MRIEFTKMHGAGNDYIYINTWEHEINDPEKLAVVLSDRHYGIGGDGIVLIMRGETPGADARMRIFNTDGSEGAMCGNGIRCTAKYLFDNKMVPKTNMTIDTMSGRREILLYTQNGQASSARVDMGRAELRPSMIPVKLSGDSVIARGLDVNGVEHKITCVSMGNPHAVVFVEEPDALDLAKIGPMFEMNEIFPNRVNTEFVKVADKNTLKMRVWERGSGETLACGTGMCAAAVAAALNGCCEKGGDIKVIAPGGELIINYTDERVYMTGNCVKVFDGVIDV
ncbi:MAG: diaminopimelate epimerase [Clostridiales Family XIII bacterium]|jgi:carbamoyl-phosphate synthase large subunit|nr:diaminopimelate epimerase [Clostridiales Family XIII bacterium]